MTTTDDEWARFARSIGASPKPAPLRRWVQSPNAGHLSGLLWGSGKPEIVLVHDLGDSSNGWDGVSIRLDRSAVALDLPGHGRSSSATAIAPPARQASALIDAIRSFAPTAALVVASGYGAVVALHAAAKRPQSIRAILVVDGSPTADGIGPLIPGNTDAPAELASWLDVGQFRDLTQPIGVVTTDSEVSDPLVRSILQRWPGAHRETIHTCPGDLIATSPTAVAAAIEAFAAALATTES